MSLSVTNDYGAIGGLSKRLASVVEFARGIGIHIRQYSKSMLQSLPCLMK